MRSSRVSEWIISISLFIGLTVAAPVWATVNSCPEIFNPASIAESVHLFRATRLQPVPRGSTMTVNGVEYRLLAVLGKNSATTAYLAERPDGRKMMVKRVKFGTTPANRSAGWVRYEVAATRFYREMQLPVLRIVDHEIKIEDGTPVEGFIVKTYVEGVTGSEIGRAIADGSIDGNFGMRLRSDLDRLVARYKKAHERFEGWLENNEVDLGFDLTKPSDRASRRYLVEEGDSQLHNFIYDTRARTWLLYDP